MPHRRAIEFAPDKRVITGLLGNLGALIMNAPGRLDDAFAYTEQAISAGEEASQIDPQVLAGMSTTPLLTSLPSNGR